MKQVLCAVAILGVCALAAQQVQAQQTDEYIINEAVNIPFSAALGIGVARQQLNLAPGKYEIRLTVERADWDKNAQSVADAVGIGGNYLIQDKATNRDIKKTDWFTRNGWLGWSITVPPNSRVYLFYSTIAPLGAKGRLTVKRED